MTEKQFVLGPGCCTKVVAPEPVFGGTFLPAGLVYSVVLGHVLHAGLVQVLQLLLLGSWGSRSNSTSRTW